MADRLRGCAEQRNTPPRRTRLDNGLMALLTVGHGRLDGAGLVALLTGAGVEQVVDVRRFPASRRNPDLAREALSSRLPEAGVPYRWEPALGGRRRLERPDDARSPDSWWRVDAFRAYAAHTRTPEFRNALADVLAAARTRTVAVMCSEAVWWRCHRRIVADIAVLTSGVAVTHLMPDGRLQSHEPSAGARVVGGDVFWDGPAHAST